MTQRQQTGEAPAKQPGTRNPNHPRNEPG